MLTDISIFCDTKYRFSADIRSQEIYCFQSLDPRRVTAHLTPSPDFEKRESSMDLNRASNQDVLVFLAKRLRATRLQANVTQQDLAEKAGLSVITVKRAESGRGNTTILTFVALLRALGKVEQLGLILPEPNVRPMDLAKASKPLRQRASSPREGQSSEASNWRWGDETK